MTSGRWRNGQKIQMIYKGEKVDVECKKAENSVPKSAYESYSAFANTKGGYIILGVDEDKKKNLPEERFIIQGITNPGKQLEDFWNTINGSKVNVNILKDEDVFVVEDDVENGRIWGQCRFRIPSDSCYMEICRVDRTCVGRGY